MLTGLLVYQIFKIRMWFFQMIFNTIFFIWRSYYFLGKNIWSKLNYQKAKIKEMGLFFKIIKILAKWKSSVNTSSNLLTQRMKTERCGTQSKSSTQKMMSHGHSEIGTVKWERFMKNVWRLTKRTICQNFNIGNGSEIPMKTSFRKEKNNFKTITTLFYPLLISRSCLVCSNFLTGPNQRRKR
jgi:hypothetical protein